MADFDEFLDNLKKGLLELGRTEIKEYVDAISEDGLNFVKEAEADLMKWSQQLLQGEMSNEGFEMAVKGKAELAKMEALTQTGLAKIKVDKIKQAILNNVVAAALKTYHA